LNRLMKANWQVLEGELRVAVQPPRDISPTARQLNGTIPPVNLGIRDRVRVCRRSTI
jgi:hypothetical protein